MVSKVASDATVREKFVPIGQQINGIIGKAAFYGSSKSALSMTSAIFANHSYILGESDSAFVDGLRARADFIEAAAMSATSTIVNFFYSIGATVLAIGAFGQSETMNAAFTRNWMHTKVSFKAAIGSAIGGLTPGGAAYFYKGAATDVAVALRNDITNIIQAAADSKLTDKELTRGLISYLKTELAGAGRNGLSLAKRIAPQAIEFLTQATEIKVKANQAQEISNLETAHKEALKTALKGQANKDEREYIKEKLKKEHKAELKGKRETHKQVLTQNTNFFNTLSDAFKEDATFKEIGSYVSSTLDGLANARKGDKGAKALEKNVKAKDESYDKMANLAAKKFLVANAENNLKHIENNPVKAASVSEGLKAALKDARKIKDSKERKTAIKAAEKNIKAEEKLNKKTAEAQQKLKLVEAKARVAMASKNVEILDKYSELKEVKAAHEVAQKRLDKLANKKHQTDAIEAERKELEKSIKSCGKDEAKIEKAISKIYVKILTVEEKKPTEKKLASNKSEYDKAVDKWRPVSNELNRIYNLWKPLSNEKDRLSAILEADRTDVDKADLLRLDREVQDLARQYHAYKREHDFDNLKKQKEDLEGKAKELEKKLADTEKKISKGLHAEDLEDYATNLMKQSMDAVSGGFKNAVKDTSGNKGVIPMFDRLARQFISTWFTRTQPEDGDMGFGLFD